jgi:uncharacterized protein YjiS (DUF1127 family)
LTARVEAALRALGAWVARGLARWKRQREARAVYLALHQLDARTLHDLGLGRSEILSVAYEFAGATESTRAHSVPALRGRTD